MFPAHLAWSPDLKVDTAEDMGEAVKCYTVILFTQLMGRTQAKFKWFEYVTKACPLKAEYFSSDCESLY